MQEMLEDEGVSDKEMASCRHEMLQHRGELTLSAAGENHSRTPDTRAGRPAVSLPCYSSTPPRAYNEQLSNVSCVNVGQIASVFLVNSNAGQ